MSDDMIIRIYEKNIAELETEIVKIKTKINAIKKNNYIAKPVPDNGKEPEIKYCECGCGTVVKRRFVRGHYKPNKGT